MRETARFEVEAVLTVKDRAYVLARLLDADADFRLTSSSTLDGRPIEEWLDLPRALNPDGTTRLDAFAFCLRSVADQEHFRVGQEVQLAPLA